jgi:MYXO-CTERM domain-containing protein
LVVFGGYGDGVALLNDTWLLYTRGGSCSSGKDCGSGNCTDGVCCETPSCGSCQTCAGLDPGICSPLFNIEDPDSCAAKDAKICSSAGTCQSGLGAACSAASPCGTGICVDGICCDTGCDAACVSCKASEKIAGDDGRCGPAKVGSNPAGRCKNAGTCNAQAACESKVTVVKGAICKNRQTLEDRDGNLTPCAPYTCEGDACKGTCKSIDDCVAPATCSGTGTCISPIASAPDDTQAAGCACRTSQPATNPLPWLALGVIGWAIRSRRRPRAWSPSLQR